MDIEQFDEGLKTCKMCLSDKRTSYHNININGMRFKEKDMRKMRNIEKTKQDYNKTFQSKIVSCSVCNCSMTQANYYKHKKTEKHQRNLNNGQ